MSTRFAPRQDDSTPEFAGIRALVTGGAPGIGLATAIALAEREFKALGDQKLFDEFRVEAIVFEQND